MCLRYCLCSTFEAEKKTVSMAAVSQGADGYKAKMHCLTFGYIRGLKLKWLISADIYDLCFDYFYAERLFNYESDGDENGILFWLGTNYGQNKWKNPASQGLVTLSSSRVGVFKY